MLVEILRSNDVVMLSSLEAALRADRIEPLVFDAYTSLAEGSIGILPRRVMVHEDDAEQARAILEALKSGPAAVVEDPGDDGLAGAGGGG